MLAVSLGLVACSSNKNTKQQNSTALAQNTKSAKYQIIDQEFDNLLAPEKDYDSLSAAELQACGDSYLPNANLKPLTKAKVKAAAKANVNLNEHEKEVYNEHNIYYVENGQNVLQSSTKTTTVYKDGMVASQTTTTDKNPTSRSTK